MSLHPDFAAELRKRLTGEVRFDLASRLLYSTDASSYQIMPLGVVVPRHRDEVQAALEIAARCGAPILARGAGTSLAGQAVGAALVIDFSKYLNRILEINPEEGWARVEPGVVCDALMGAACSHGLTFGTEPASSDRATLGGMLNNNSTGAHSLLYGMTADQVLSAKVFLADGSAAHFTHLDADELRSKQSLPGLEGEIYRGLPPLLEQYAPLIRERYPRTWRRASGYSLNYLLPPHGYAATRPAGWPPGHSYPRGGMNPVKLLAAAEGTLAVVAEATFRLVPLPRRRGLCVAHFESVTAAADATPFILESHPSAVELMDAVMLRATRSVPAYARLLRWVQGEPGAVLVVEFFGESEKEVLTQIERLEARLTRAALARTFVRAVTPQEQADVWGVRKVGLGLLMSARGDAKPLPFMEDVAVPVEHLGRYVREVGRIFDHYGISSAYYAHASAGCLHIRPALNLKTAEGVATMRRVAEEVLQVVVALGGAMSGEHGDGLSRSCWNERLFGRDLYRAFQRLKWLFDPENRLNPGKIVDAADMTENLRYGPDYRVQTITPHLDFDLEGGFAGAVEQCNGAGVCRKAGGVMCPSFQATREEMHSTRGRANLLRAMIAGPAVSLRGGSSRPSVALSLSKRVFRGRIETRRSNLQVVEEIASPSARARNDTLEKDVFEALDLCLACKGCKAECPSGVDVAKLKYEFRAQYYHSHPRPLRDYLFAYVGPLARLAAPFARLVNWLGGLGWIRRLAARWLGIAAQRLLPRFGVIASATKQSPRERGLLRRLVSIPLRFAQGTRPAAPRHDSLERALYLPDAFTRYFEPEIERAALDVLAACGVEALTLPVLGAGRTLLSEGFLPAAKKHAARLLDAIQRLDPVGQLAVIGVEPSEIYTLRDEFFDLLPERKAEVEALAGRAYLLDEFLIRPGGRADGQRILRVANILKSTITQNNPKAHLHGHCHQKAQPPTADGHPVGQEASAELLRALGYEVEIIPSGCCGMAGAFGYEAEHYDLSMQVGELVLFPYIRELGIGNQESGIRSRGGCVVALGASCRAQISDGAGVTAQHTIVLVAERVGSWVSSGKTF